MNKQAKASGKRGIEWTNYTWNPVGGCQHGCRWLMPDGSVAECYAETVAERVAQSAYPHGFEHHYWRPELLHEPLQLTTPSRIFLDSMSDLMGHWVSEEEIEAVLDICAKADWHHFQLLTKNAPRLLQFKFPPNVWVGVSAPPTTMFGKNLSLAQQERMVSRMMDVLQQVDVPVRWMSIEPLSFDIGPLLREATYNGPPSAQPPTARRHISLSQSGLKMCLMSWMHKERGYSLRAISNGSRGARNFPFSSLLSSPVARGYYVDFVCQYWDLGR